MATVAALLDALRGGPASSRELQGRLQLSQPTVARLLARAESEVVRWGRGRSTRYGRRREAFGAGREIAIYAVDQRGVVTQIATLCPLAGGGYLVESHLTPAPRWLLGAEESGLFAGIPYFLYDLRPAGFIGRQLALQLATTWGYATDPRDWSDEQIGSYLVQRGDGLPGQLVLGSPMAERVRLRSVEDVGEPTEAYPRLAERALSNLPTGASAAGEQPKFAVYTASRGHVIVKFSPATDSASAVRWRDLLVAEQHASQLLASRGFAAADTRVIDAGGRRFLESQRFDRRGDRGRLPAMTLAMVDAEFVGLGHGWTRVASALVEGGLLDRTAGEHIRWCESFGAWIGNTDMHLGNFCLSPTLRGFELLPVFDMLPMLFAPVREELPQRELRAPIRDAANAQVWAEAGHAARDYWGTLADDPLVSDAFRQLSARCASAIDQLL